MQKHLTKSRDKILTGVLGGIAEYFDWDKAWTRIAGGALICFTGWGLILYIIAAFAIPEHNRPDNIPNGEYHKH
ncbi:PspC domain-containing protein [Lactobacillus sp. ESL0731]|uniref:PspC domain-containing protein n=1 Tax=unclassified Lactobacillus TaxID=2620435 RepID=UPI0023F82599|nr:MULTISPECIES: PspC domain-containing protein [unclassified Lactobacillus]WEV50594.1 PspC domain-containing protein [Lactobacillus sp. ESL0700]WEV61724.1 PspC domain-containing protein [Lactobacillus sp. ESL0731]